MSGLDSAALHHRFMSSKNVFLYCSETTENLLMCNPSYSHLKNYIRSIPLEQQTIIPLIDDKTNKQSSICVTLLAAGHCVGSVMFLFEGPHGNVLYTGDFRLARGDVKRISFLHANGRIKDIKSIYIDTTFCLPKTNSLPSREQSRETIIKLIDRWFSRGPEYAVSLLCKGMYGFEYLLKEVAMNYRTKIHISDERLAMYRYLPDMTPHFTTDGRSTKIHACKWQSKRICDSELPCGSLVHPSVKTKVMRIKPTTMWVARDTKPMPADFKRYDKDKKLWRVVHSMHASMEEIQDLVGYLRPYHVYPNVPPAGLDTLEDAFERLKGLTRLEECDSCNQDDSGEERFQEHAAGHFGDCLVQSEQTSEEKTTLTKLPHVSRPAPDEKVLALCKELGLDEDDSLAPVPKRRKAKTPGISLEEKISSASQSSGPGTFAFKNVTNQQLGRKTEVFFDAKTSEDRESRQTPLQLDETTACPPRTELKSIVENRTCKDAGEQSNSTSLPKQDYLTRNSSSALEEGRDATLENSCAHFMDGKTKLHRTGSSERLYSLEERSSQGGSLGGKGLVGNGTDFSVPPSPGHIEPQPDKLSRIHHLLQSGEPLPKVLKF